MTATPTTTQADGSTVLADGTDPARARRRVAAVGLGLGALTIAGLLVTTPWGERNATSYDEIAPVRDAAWAGMLADGIAFAVVGLLFSMTVLSLVRGRGRVPALVGAIVTSLGGLLFAMGSFAFASLAWYATSSAIPVDAGKALMAYAAENPQHGFVPAMVGFLLFTVGSLLLAASLLRSRAVPLAAVIVFAVLTLSQFAGVEGRGLDFVQIALMLLLTGLAVVGFRRS
ncbi:hypothetical protein MLP_35520 [Microlunatus phosphovorus NM-1]|uniref:DUF4386 family protein n=1 Tax=Microlunatus phosphovorus (strain ATCC 700054 / DSM 10555 / JCM 9379 / NBRC 101784 / NCIMB 13414 / VKM Ac-1990 / NM-1) TaxID=1032480 RepID=F5XNB6_MICPN|nr:hypothetical protein MLP_35520 [Microlunatus phosphovorus NM-1]